MKVIKNSDASPEQYDVYDSSDNFLGKIKFQFGQLDVYNSDGNSILTKSVNDDLLGRIPDNLRKLG